MTKKSGKIRDDFYKKYDFMLKGEHAKCFITALEHLGINDPFPKDHASAKHPKCERDNNPKYTRKSVIFDAKDLVNNLVYEKERYFIDQSPYRKYIPNKETMFKLMRACVDCKTVDDLWVSSIVE